MIPSRPWRNSSIALPLRATCTPEFLAWRLLGELREEPVSLPVRDYPRREDPIVPELQIDFSFTSFILLSFPLASGFVYVASGSRSTFRPVARPPIPASRLPHVVDTSIVASRQETASGRRTPGCQLHARSRHPHSSSARPLPLACKARSHLTFAACHPSLDVKWRSEILPWGCW